MHWDAKKLFQVLPIYNTFIEKPKIKKLPNVELLTELPFYDELKISKNKTAFTGYARSYKIEIADERDVIIQLKASEFSIKELLKELLNELKRFKYQITLPVLMSNIKTNGEIEYFPVYFNSTTKTVINDDYKLDQAFQEIVYRLDNSISHGSGWIVEEISNQYLNISSDFPLIGNTYIKLSSELQHPMKGLTNIQNNDNKCFLWRHVKHLNLVGKKLQRIRKIDEEIVNKLNYSGIDFPVSKKDYRKIKLLSKICVNVFCYENKTTYPVYFSNQNFNDSMD